MITGLSGRHMSQFLAAVSRNRQAAPGGHAHQLKAQKPAAETMTHNGHGHAGKSARASASDHHVARYEKIRQAHATRPRELPAQATRPRELPGGAKETSMLDRMRAAFFSASGDNGFDGSLDLNRDGAINFADMAIYRAKLHTQPSRPMELTTPTQETLKPGDDVADEVGPVVQDPEQSVSVTTVSVQTVSIETVSAAFFTGAGDKAFNAGADLNGDGRVDFNDLAALRNSGDA